MPRSPEQAQQAPSIVVVGSSNTDMVIELQRLPRPGETLLGGRFFTAAGGKGANQAVGAARAGGRVSLVARVGADALGDQALAALQREGIDVRRVGRDRAAPSGVALIFVARGGANSIAVAGGANAKLTPTDIRKAAPAIRAAAVLVVQLETPLPSVLAAARIAAHAGVPVILNPAPAPFRPLPRALLRRVAILTPNETEAEALTGVRVLSDATAAKACDILRSQGVNTVILTLGARGAFVDGPAGRQHVPGFKVKAVDTTAAGDMFNGALAVALAEGRRLEDAVRFAHAAAALSVMRAGAQPSAASRRRIDAFLKRGR